jgi:hypothetical protein
MSQPSDAVLAAIAAVQTLPPDERMAHARGAAASLRDLQLVIADLEQRLKEAQSQLRTLQFETLPAILDNLGVDRIGLPAQNNLPACDLILTPFYKAAIRADWPPEKRAAAFAALTALGHEDLIKTEIDVALPRGQHQLAEQIAERIRDFGVEPQISEAVHHGTLTAWLTARLEAHMTVPDLETIGATVGRIARLKERREP